MRSALLVRLSLAAACALVFIAAAPAGTSAKPSVSQRGLGADRVQHQKTLATWRGAGAGIRTVGRRGARPAGVIVARRGRTRTTFGAFGWPRPVAATRAGTVYRVRGTVRSRPGSRLCLRVREVSRRAGIGRTARCVVGTGRWQRIGSVTLRAKRSGSKLGIGVYNRTSSGNLFEFRSITLSFSAPARNVNGRGCKRCSAPLAVTGAASAVADTSAALSGILTPGSSESGTAYWFEFGATAAYGSATARQPAGSGSSAVPISASLAALATGTTYHFRLVAVNQAGQRAGADQAFTTTGTPPLPPTVQATPTSGNPGMGVQFHCLWSNYTNENRAAVLDKMKAAGVSWVRIDAAWAGIEDTLKGVRNAWYLGMLDYCVNEAGKRGIKVLVTLWRTPGWANGGAGYTAPPYDAQDYADFARWAAAYFRGRVQAWEVWNEPDPDQPYWTGTTQQYANLLKAAYPSFKGGDPDALVVLGGPSSNDNAWLGGVYAFGAKGSFDVLSTHPYQGLADAAPETADTGDRWWFTHLPAVRNVMVQYGDADKPIWFTEFGWSAHENWTGVENWNRGVTEAQQAAYLVRAIEYTRKNYPYVTGMFWYKERSSATSATTGSAAHLEGFGLLRADLSERPAFTALKLYLTGT